MKKLLTLLLLIATTSTAIAQLQDRYDGLLPSVSLFTNQKVVGIELTAEMDWGYISPSAWHENSEMNYSFVGTSAGININRLFHERATSLRPYFGVGGGILFRKDGEDPTFLMESGLTYYTNFGLVLGVKSNFQKFDEVWKGKVFGSLGIWF